MNAGSGNSDSALLRAQIAEVFEAAQREHHFLLVQDASRLPQVAREAVRQALQQQGVVVAAGGDGTINAVAEAVLPSGCPFGVLPQGTFNYFARAHGIPQDSQAAARALLRAQLRPMHIGQVNDRAFLVNASLGLYPKLLEDRETFKSQFGRSRLVAMVSGLRTLFGNRRQLQLSIELEGQARALRTPTLFVGNNRLQLERLGIAEAPELDRDRLVAIAVKPIRGLQMLMLVLRGALGRLGEAEQVTSFAFRSLTVHTRGARRVKVGMDGEIRQLRPPLVFGVSTQALMLLVPHPDDQVTAE
jgi:diacylglycerol kinase family enzyme